jgi:hypothetical protein
MCDRRHVTIIQLSFIPSPTHLKDSGLLTFRKVGYPHFTTAHSIVGRFCILSLTSVLSTVHGVTQLALSLSFSLSQQKKREKNNSNRKAENERTERQRL